MGGLLCFAFSTSALLALAQPLVRLPFPDEQAAIGRSNQPDGKSN
jgi:hypothetical protein